MAFMGTLGYGCSPPIYKHYEYKIFTKTLLIISISTKIYIPYLCNLLGLYILLVNNLINLRIN